MSHTTLSALDGSSPHTRGARDHRHRRRPPRRIIPAYAGSTPGACTIAASSTDHPRIRGEHETDTLAHKQQVRIIPAYAGSTPSGTSRRGTSRDHPRIRGEHARLMPPTTGGGGSSPHTRGAHARRTQGQHRQRIIPAYAGSTLSCEIVRDPLVDHPRIRGEHRPGATFSISQPGSSPHTRGARLRLRGPQDRRRIIPAYAGSTRGCPDRGWRGADHPRIRGEHLPIWGFLGASLGSSPHTRGAR